MKDNAANRRIIDTIVPVAEWNKDKPVSEQIPVKYGYVIPLYHGHEWKKTKKQLIEKYCY
jgi:hypothetical protein